MAIAEVTNIAKQSTAHQFFLQLRGHPSSRVHVLRCPGDISFSDFLRRASSMAAPFYPAPSTNGKATTPVYGVVSNIQFQENGRTYKVADKDGFTRACRIIARRESERLRGSGCDPLLLTFEVVYPQFGISSQRKRELWARLKEWLRAKAPGRVKGCLSNGSTEW